MKILSAYYAAEKSGNKFLENSVTAIAKNGDANREVGFMTGKPFLEDTGFAEFNRPKNGSDKVGIEMILAGLITIEEGILQGNEIRLVLKYSKSIFGALHPTNIKAVSNI
uniref:Peptidase_M24 domain-containing protein n=1 Tax=Ascaris lumbricoides TaxID=6252 RepID=A0A0M3IGM0_ASCLU